MKVKMAHTIQFYLCEQCSSVHIGMFRNGKLFAEAIPVDAEAVLDDFVTAVKESKKQALPTTGVKH